MAIHPTAIISPKAEIASDVDIGPYCVVEGDVKIGAGSRLHGRVHIFEHTEIGRQNEIHDGAILGNVPQDRAFKGAVSYVRIGDRNVFREGSWVHRGSTEGSSTVIGNDNYLMGFAHVAHNCTVGNRVTLASNTLLAGHTTVEDRAFVSANVIVHQFCRLGQGALVSGLSALNKDVAPFMIAGGRPAVVIAVNVIGLRRAGVPPHIRDALKRAYKLLFRSEVPLAQALSLIESSATSAEERHLVEFIRASKRGIAGGRRKHVQPDLLPESDENGDLASAEEEPSFLGWTD